MLLLQEDRPVAIFEEPGSVWTLRRTWIIRDGAPAVWKQLKTSLSWAHTHPIHRGARNRTREISFEEFEEAAAPKRLGWPWKIQVTKTLGLKWFYSYRITFSLEQVASAASVRLNEVHEVSGFLTRFLGQETLRIRANSAALIASLKANSWVSVALETGEQGGEEHEQHLDF